jgi:hypothetical protein
LIDVNLVLGTINGTLLQSGVWLNVIGYIHTKFGSKLKRKRGKADNTQNDPPLTDNPVIQAILIWDASTVKIEKYEKIMEAQKDAWIRTRTLHEDPE